MRKQFIAALLCVVSIGNFSNVYAKDSKDIDVVKQEIEDIKNTASENYDVQKAVAALYEKLNILEEKYKDASAKDEEITRLTDKLNQLEKDNESVLEEKKKIKDYLENLKQNPPQDEKFDQKVEQLQYDEPRQPTRDYVINTPNSAKSNNYIQDGANAQGYARMVFAYGPEQVYKIYCKIGYLTDIKFADNENITYVGGGDTAQWMIDHATVNNTSHLYVKPIANNISTNIVVNTDKGHIYQVLLNSGDWFNPMVTWSYGNESIVKTEIKNKEDTAYVLNSNINPEMISFDYKIKAKKYTDFKPTTVFNDGKKTYIRFADIKTLPVLFIRDKDTKNLILANYKNLNNTFIVDNIFDEAVLKIADQEVIITRKD